MRGQGSWGGGGKRDNGGADLFAAGSCEGFGQEDRPLRGQARAKGVGKGTDLFAGTCEGCARRATWSPCSSTDLFAGTCEGCGQEDRPLRGRLVGFRWGRVR
jgi:hypothetical protein